MNKEIITNCKNYIDNYNDEECKNYILYIIEQYTNQIIEYKDAIYQDTTYRLSYEYIFQQVYLHECLKKNESLAKWMKEEIYTKHFDVIQQIALRQMFIYGNYLLRKE